MAVVLIMKMQHAFQVIPMVICNIYFGVFKISIHANHFLADIMAQLRHVGPRPEMGSAHDCCIAVTQAHMGRGWFFFQKISQFSW